MIEIDKNGKPRLTMRQDQRGRWVPPFKEIDIGPLDELPM